MPEPEYSVQGYAFATVAYATAHKIPMPQVALDTGFKRRRCQSTPFTEYCWHLACVRICYNTFVRCIMKKIIKEVIEIIKN
ncbi:MAG: hypothetical protein K1W06_05080, partial [Lachnospiraceae bacterium]